MPAAFMLLYWFALQLIGGLTAVGDKGGVAFWAHVGGFVTRMVLVLLFRDPVLVERHPYHAGTSRRA